MADIEHEGSSGSESAEAKARKEDKKRLAKMERESLQKRMKEVVVESKNRVVNFLKKFILGKKPEDRKKIVDSAKEKKVTDKEASEAELEKKFEEIKALQAKGVALNEQQEQLLSRVAAEAAVNLEAQKQLKAEVPESEPKSSSSTETPKRMKPNLATIEVNALTPEMLLQYDFSDYDLVDDAEDGKLLVLKTPAAKEAALKKVFAKKPSTPKTEEREYDRKVIPRSEVTPEMLADPEFRKKYRPKTEDGKTYYVLMPAIAGGADDSAIGPDPPGEPETERPLETGGDTEAAAFRAADEQIAKMSPEERKAWLIRNAENESYRQRLEAQQGGNSGIPGLSGRGFSQEIPEPPENGFLPPRPDEEAGETTDSPSYQEKLQQARNKYFNDEKRGTELEAARRRGVVYLSQVLEAAESETEASWIIEDSLRAGENDLVSPQSFEQAVNQVIQAVDLVFSGDQARREKFTRLARARLVAYGCEYTARYINATGLSEQITNYFQDHLETMRDLPGVKRMIQMIEERDTVNELGPDGKPLNIRGAYFRKLNFEENKDKKDEWYHYYKESERSSKDQKWGVWVVDKKYQIFDEAKRNNAPINLDYIDQFKDKEDEELIKILLVKTHGKNDPVQAIKDLHREVFDQEMYTGLNIPRPKDYFLDEGVKARLQQNKKFKASIRELTEDERKSRGRLIEDTVALTQNSGVALDRMIYQLNRAATLAQRIEHSFQFSTHWDNIRWKKHGDMTAEQKELFDKALAEINGADHRNLDEYGRNAAGTQIILNPMIEWAMDYDPRYPDSKMKKAQKSEHINLRIAGEKKAKIQILNDQLKYEKDKERIKALEHERDELKKDKEVLAIDKIRDAKNHLFTIAWDKTYREFYEKYWDLIDFEGSFYGDSSREARKAQYFGRTLEQSGEAEPGKRYMRRFAETGAKDMGMFFAFESAFDMIDNFTGVFNRVKRWSSVMKQGDKLRGVLMDMLNNPELLADPTKFLTEIKKNYRPHMSTDETYDKEYYSDAEYFQAYHHLESQLDYVTGKWAEGIIEYNKAFSWQQHGKDLQQEVLIKHIGSMVAHELITPDKASKMLDANFGPLPKRMLHELVHVMIKPKIGIGYGIAELFKEMGKAWDQGLKS